MIAHHERVRALSLGKSMTGPLDLQQG